MKLSEDTIVEISKSLERFFGRGGKMLKPSRATVEALIAKIPEDKVITIPLLRDELARQFGVEVTCPSDTKQALKAIANDPQENVPFWRVLKANGELVSYFPDGIEGQAAHLEAEGFVLDTQSKTPKVKEYKERLADFE